MLVKMELEDLGGVDSATSDFVSGVTEVSYDPEQVTVDDMIAAIVRAGYGAQVA
jgi:copper chaperone CopZ